MRRMRELGMIVDVTHASRALLRDIAELPDEDRPAIILSHTGIMGVCDHGRNADDESLRLVAKRDGLIGIAVFKPAMCGEDIVLSFTKSVAHAAGIAGIDRIALGSDWDGAVHTSVSAADVQVLAQALRVHGNFSEKDVRNVMYYNARRFFERNL